MLREKIEKKHSDLNKNEIENNNESTDNGKNKKRCD